MSFTDNLLEDEEGLHPDNDDYFKDMDEVQEQIDKEISTWDDEDEYGTTATDGQSKVCHNC